MKVCIVTRNIVAATALLGAVAAWNSAAGAAKLYVANNGFDSGSCGPIGFECRSITGALANANVLGGDTIIVGPGRYGDIDGDGFLGGIGEEMSGAWAIYVSIPVKIVSSHGAASTIIDAPGSFGGAYIESGPIVFGKASKGFTIVNANYGVFVSNSSFPKVKIGGNVILGDGSTFGIYSGFDGTSIANNRVVNHDTGIDSEGNGNSIKNNVATGSSIGIYVYGEKVKVKKNLTILNEIGVYIDDGFATTNSLSAFSGNSIVGNLDAGMWIEAVGLPSGGLTEKLKGNNFFGNGDRLPGPPLNCAIITSNPSTEPLNVVAQNNFWGVAAGPGANPAYAVGGACNLGTGPVTIDTTVARPTEAKVKAKPMR